MAARGPWGAAIAIGSAPQLISHISLGHERSALGGCAAATALRLAIPRSMMACPCMSAAMAAALADSLSLAFGMSSKQFLLLARPPLTTSRSAMRLWVSLMMWACVPPQAGSSMTSTLHANSPLERTRSVSLPRVA